MENCFIHARADLLLRLNNVRVLDKDTDSQLPTLRNLDESAFSPLPSLCTVSGLQPSDVYLTISNGSALLLSAGVRRLTP
jgi:hypothetical protein